MTAQTLATTISSRGYDKLSAESVKECTIVGQEGGTANDAQSLVTQAAALKLAALSERQLVESILVTS